MANATPSNKQTASFIKFIYNASIFIAFVSLIGTMTYLFVYLMQSPPPDKIKGVLPSYNAERRMTLISTAFFIAMSFGFMGFALFLIDAKGEIEGEAALPDSTKVKIAKMSPGIFALLCATIIIVISVNSKVDYTVETKTTTEPGTESNTGAAQDSAAKEARKEDLGDASTNLHPGNRNKQASKPSKKK